jgi:hypothetical protein
MSDVMARQVNEGLGHPKDAPNKYEQFPAWPEPYIDWPEELFCMTEQIFPKLMSKKVGPMRILRHSF